MGNFSADMQ